MTSKPDKLRFPERVRRCVGIENMYFNCTPSSTKPDWRPTAAAARIDAELRAVEQETREQCRRAAGCRVTCEECVRKLMEEAES